jgi:hypothetical protein
MVHLSVAAVCGQAGSYRTFYRSTAGKGSGAYVVRSSPPFAALRPCAFALRSFEGRKGRRTDAAVPLSDRTTNQAPPSYLKDTFTLAR